MNPFLALLQAPGAGGDINVIGQRPPGAVPENDPAPQPLGNRSAIEEVLQAQGNAPQRKGMFGLKGTLRDVLGMVGDAFLVGSGNKAIYNPQRQKEREADAFAGFTQNPMAAVERLSQHNPEIAAKLYDAVLENQARMAAAQGTSAKNGQESYLKGSELFGRFYGAANKDSFSRVVPILNRIKQTYGLGDEFSVGDAYDENLANAYKYGGMPTTAQVRDARAIEAEEGRNTRFTQGEKGKMERVQVQEGGRNSRDDAPQPTRASIAAPLLNKLEKGEQLTPSERDVLDRVAPPPKTKRKPPALPPGFGPIRKVTQ